jgi:hypothetical protein
MESAYLPGIMGVAVGIYRSYYIYLELFVQHLKLLIIYDYPEISRATIIWHCSFREVRYISTIRTCNVS